MPVLRNLTDVQGNQESWFFKFHILVICSKVSVSHFCCLLFVTDLSCSRQCIVPLHKATVWAVLVSPNSNLSGSLLRSGLCLVVPRKVQLQPPPALETIMLCTGVLVSDEFILLNLISMFSSSLLLFQCLLRSPVHPDSSLRVGELLVSVAEHAQSVPNQRHLLLLFCHGALH